MSASVCGNHSGVMSQSFMLGVGYMNNFFYHGYTHLNILTISNIKGITTSMEKCWVSLCHVMVRMLTVGSVIWFVCIGLIPWYELQRADSNRGWITTQTGMIMRMSRYRQFCHAQFVEQQSASKYLQVKTRICWIKKHTKFHDIDIKLREKGSLNPRAFMWNLQPRMSYWISNNKTEVSL